jgi:hypothetical protein
MEFYIEDTDSEYESDVDNIYNDNETNKEPIISEDINTNENSYFGISFKDLSKNANFDWFFRRTICLEEEIVEVNSEPFCNKKIKSDEYFTNKNCCHCKKKNIDTTFCCLLRNNSYYFCNNECWSIWINETKIPSNNISYEE